MYNEIELMEMARDYEAMERVALQDAEELRQFRSGEKMVPPGKSSITRRRRIAPVSFRRKDGTASKYESCYMDAMCSTILHQRTTLGINEYN